VNLTLSGNKLKSRLGQEGMAVIGDRPNVTTYIPQKHACNHRVICRGMQGRAKATGIKPAQNAALLCAQKSLRLILVGAKIIVRIT
jgi:hypothetical protein